MQEQEEEEEVHLVSLAPAEAEAAPVVQSLMKEVAFPGL